MRFVTAFARQQKVVKAPFLLLAKSCRGVLPVVVKSSAAVVVVCFRARTCGRALSRYHSAIR